MPRPRRKTGKTALTLLLLVGAAILFNTQPDITDNRVTGAVFEAVALPARWVHRLGIGFGDGWARYVDLREVEEQNRELVEERGQLQLKIQQLNELKEQNGRLRKLLDFSKEEEMHVVTAALFSASPNPTVERVLIDRGSSDGFQSGWPALTHQGVAGRISAVRGPRQSEIMLITDPEFRIDVVAGPDRVRGIVAGNGGDTLDLLYVPWERPLHEGDAIQTSGMAGPFPKGLAVGTVISASVLPGELFQTILVAPAVPLEKMEEVLVLVRPDDAFRPDRHPFRIQP